MKIEIRCSECGYIVDYWSNGRTIVVRPCPHCHPAKPEKVTPKNNAPVEVKSGNAVELRYASGGRAGNGCVSVSKIRDAVVSSAVDQWRYPGETDDEWKD